MISLISFCDIYWMNFMNLRLNFYIFIIINYKLIVSVYMSNHILYSMENKETNPAIVVGNDDKKEESKKDDSGKSNK